MLPFSNGNTKLTKLFAKMWKHGDRSDFKKNNLFWEASVEITFNI